MPSFLLQIVFMLNIGRVFLKVLFEYWLILTFCQSTRLISNYLWRREYWLLFLYLFEVKIIRVAILFFVFFLFFILSWRASSVVD